MYLDRTARKNSHTETIFRECAPFWNLLRTPLGAMVDISSAGDEFWNRMPDYSFFKAFLAAILT